MVDRAKVEQDWQERGFSCDMWADPPGQVWEDFVHQVDELVMVVEGKLEMEMQGEIFYPELGEEVFIPGNVLHSVRNVGGTTAYWLYGYKEEPTR